MLVIFKSAPLPIFGISSSVVDIEFQDMLLFPAFSSIFVASVNSWFATIYEYGQNCVHWVMAHSTACSIVALCAIPIIIGFSVLHREPLA